MCFDEHAEKLARHDLLEAMSGCMAASGLAPTPGISLELYEIAALRHCEVRDDVSRSVPAVLTSAENDSGIAAIVSWIGKAVAHVAGRSGRQSRPGRMPA